jgi:hypothetical protein
VAISARSAIATKFLNVVSGQCTSAARWNHPGSARKTIAVISIFPPQPSPRKSVARMIPQKPSSGRPIAGPKSSTFQASQKRIGPNSTVATSRPATTAMLPTTSAPMPNILIAERS